MSNILIHPTSDVQSSMIGDGTQIWQFCVVLPKAKIGARCNICSHVFVENDVVIGDDVTIKNGVQLYDGLRIGNRVFIGPNATFTNDLFPRSKRYPERFLNTVIDKDVSIGANATILPGISIGAGAMIGAGAVVTKNVPPKAIVVGNPGVINRFSDSGGVKPFLPLTSADPDDITTINLGVGGCSLRTVRHFVEKRGSLAVAEYEKDIPFLPKRCFWIFETPSGEVRGEHGHKAQHQFLICVRGSVSIMLDDATSIAEIVLNKPNMGLHIPPLVWGSQYRYSEDAVLFVLASDAYDSADYLRDYDDFLVFVNKKKKSDDSIS